MGSDTLQKPSQQRTLVEKFQLYRKKALVHVQSYTPRSWDPRHLVQNIAWAIYGLTCLIIGTLAALICDKLMLPPLRVVWCYLPRSFKDYLDQVNWAHLGFKVFSRILLALYACIAIAIWYSSPWGPSGQWSETPIRHTHFTKYDVSNYFTDFKGAAVCNIEAANLYSPRVTTEKSRRFCNNRASLLLAMSEGGRHGFDAPYVPHGCHYRWFSVEEICAIFDRFDALVFIGDDNLEMIYAGFNILLRKDLQYGSLTWQIPSDKLSSCTCNSQFTDLACHKYFVRNSKEVPLTHNEVEAGKYLCQRMPHALLRIGQPPASIETIAKFSELVRPAPPSNYKPIPIIHSLTSDASIEDATDSVSQFIMLSDVSKRKTPMLWIGPTAAGHVDIKGRRGNQEIWHFATKMADIAKAKDIETLGLWNLTVQANSYDGKGFGEDVSIVAAMMVINWLARLESS